jgi:hypothetical protein
MRVTYTLEWGAFKFVLFLYFWEAHDMCHMVEKQLIICYLVAPGSKVIFARHAKMVGKKRNIIIWHAKNAKQS